LQFQSASAIGNPKEILFTKSISEVGGQVMLEALDDPLRR
jgi:hypothetical protein